MFYSKKTEKNNLSLSQPIIHFSSDPMPKVIINITKPVILASIITYVYRTSSLEYVFLLDKKGKRIKYRNVECDESEECDFETIVSKRPQHMKLKFKSDTTFLSMKEDDDCFDMPESDFNKLQNNRMQDIRLRVSGDVHLVNPKGVNWDHRGANHTRLELDFFDELNLKRDKDGCIAYSKLACALYKLKSHKFDNWYEMYIGTETLVKNGNLYAKVDFDHGS